MNEMQTTINFINLCNLENIEDINNFYQKNKKHIDLTYKKYGDSILFNLLENRKIESFKYVFEKMTYEESYTSKTSFIDNEELKVFKEKEKKLEENKKVEIIGDESSKVKNKENSNDKIDGKGKLKNSKNLTQGTKNQLSGKRVNQIFISNYKSKRVKIHADINGSFNIVRKVLNGLKYDKKLMTIDYQLMELALGGKKKLFNFYDQKTLNKVNVKKNKSSVKNLNQTVVEVANNLNLVVLSTTL